MKSQPWIYASLLLLMACDGPSQRTSNTNALIAAQQTCEPARVQHYTAHDRATMEAFVACQEEHMMPIYISKRPEKEADIKAAFSDMHLMLKMHDEKKVNLRHAISYCDKRLLQLSYAHLPECDDETEGRKCAAAIEEDRRLDARQHIRLVRW